MSDEDHIRQLITDWATAVHAGDLATVMTRHAADIVMYDVPPPERGVRGLDAYRATWPPFFEWQASGSSFEIRELDVVAGHDIAYAYALLRGGTPEELAEHPERLLRISFGLRRRDDVWEIQHEHHSFPL